MTSFRSLHIPCLFALLFPLSLAVTANAAPMLISGSSTVQKRVIEPAAKTLEKKTGAKIEISGAGSIRGLKDLMKGEAVAAMLSCPLDVAVRVAGMPGEGTFREHVLFQDNVVAIVHPSNRVRSLTLAQLADISTGKVTNWKAVGGKDARIVVVAPPAASGTRAFVRDAVMKGADFASGAYVTVTDREAIDVVAMSPISIALLSEGFVKASNGKKVKTVKTPPLKRPLSLVTKDTPSKELLAMIKYLQSKDAKKLFR
jgi:phosphate transport system substrate-binding protein